VRRHAVDEAMRIARDETSHGDVPGWVALELADAIDRVRALCSKVQEDETGADVDTLWPSQILSALNGEMVEP
jgi:hypothetical protein